MEKLNITEEQAVHKEWYVQAKEQTLATLPEFLRHIMEDYGHDYGTICHALAAGAVATAWAMNAHPQGGITGFQSGAVMWEFIQNWTYTNNKCGLRIMDFDNMCYPQYDHKFAKTIKKSTHDAMVKHCVEMLAQKDRSPAAEVRKHWEFIAGGGIPFGYAISDN